MPRPQRRATDRGRSGYWMLIFGVIVAVAVTAGTVVVIQKARSRVIADESGHLRSFAAMLAAEADRSLEAVDVVEDSIIDALRTKGVSSPETLLMVAASEETHRLLLSKIQNMPQLDAVGLMDASGILLASSRSSPMTGFSIAHRQFYKDLMADPSMHSIVGEPMIGRMSGAWVVLVLRKIFGPDGSVIGLVTGVIQLPYFERLYARMALPEDSAITLVRRDGIVLTRFPRAEAAIGTKIPLRAPEIAASLDVRDQMVIHKQSVIDRQDRLIALRALASHPILTAVSRTEDQILRPWRREAASLVAVAVLMDMVAFAAGFLGMRQIRASQGLTEQAQRLARYDALTELPNRLLFREELDSAVAGLLRDGAGFALLLLDLDGFKDVNDTFGHQVGDDLLRAVSARLRGCAPPHATLGRLGGDEFAIILVGGGEPNEVAALATRIIGVADQPYDLESGQIIISASIGAALAPSHGIDPDELMKNADLALYRAKDEGRSRFCIFEAELADKFTARQTLERDLRGACERGEFELYYQPILSLRTGALIGCEALLRWTHPERGTIPPAEFIPVAEETGLIGTIGAWALREACRDATGWPAHMTVAVNLSPVQFKIRDIGQDIAEALVQSGLVPERLEVEITESVRIDEDGATKATLHRIKEQGVAIALDDFGTGYSSLSYLRSFPFDRIKIDRSFVAEMHASTDCAIIIETALGLARRLGMSVTAEGVETMPQHDTLRVQGCTEIQGYLVSRPMSAQATQAFVAGYQPPLARVA